MTQATDEINTIVEDLLQRYKDAVKDSGHEASGQLEKTARYKVQYNGKWVEVIFNLESYWKYLENGTKPHFPPVDAIEQWVKVKKIVPVAVSGRVPTTRQLAYLISRGISIHGTKETKLLQKTIDDSQDLIDSLCEAITNQIEQELNKDIEDSL